MAHKIRTLSPSQSPSLTQICEVPLATENFRQNMQRSLSKAKLSLDQLQQASTLVGHDVMSLLPLVGLLFIKIFLSQVFLGFIFSARYEMQGFCTACYIKLRQQRWTPGNDLLLI